MPNYSKRIVYLTEAQRKELFLNDTIIVDGVTVTYNENDIYVTPQEMQLSVGTVTTLSSGSSATASITGDPEDMTLNLGIPKGDTGELRTVTVSGTEPVIVADSNTRYVCGELASLSFTPSATGICDVVFTSGTTATVLDPLSGVMLPEWFEVEANHTYEISIADGVYGAVMVW